MRGLSQPLTDRQHDTVLSRLQRTPGGLRPADTDSAELAGHLPLIYGSVGWRMNYCRAASGLGPKALRSG